MEDNGYDHEDQQFMMDEELDYYEWGGEGGGSKADSIIGIIILLLLGIMLFSFIFGLMA